MKMKMVFHDWLIVCVSLLLLFLIPTSSPGATFCVSDATELQSALNTAESNGEDNTIQIVQGTYNGNFTYASTEAYSLTVEGGYTQDCATRTIDPANTILDGGGTDMVLALVSQGAADFSMEGLALQHGSASTVDHGGGLYVKTEDSNVTLNNNVFTENTGGGLYASNGGGNVTLNNNVFTENTGGGLYASNGGGNVTLNNNMFTENTASGAGGGATISLRDTVLTLTDNSFIDNTSSGQGGGLHAVGPWKGSAGTTTLTQQYIH